MPETATLTSEKLRGIITSSEAANTINLGFPPTPSQICHIPPQILHMVGEFSWVYIALLLCSLFSVKKKVAGIWGKKN